MTQDQTELAKGIKKVMEQNEVTNFIYESSYDLPLKSGETTPVSASSGIGAIYIFANKNENLEENYIIIDPNIPSEIPVNLLTDNFYVGEGVPTNISNAPTRFRKSTFKTNVADATFHELGHVIYNGKRQDKVIRFNNTARRILGLPKREQDETHNSRITNHNLYE